VYVCNLRALILYRRRRFINHLLTFLLTYRSNNKNNVITIKLPIYTESPMVYNSKNLKK